ncbi:4-hydroxy-tetrahydrodipicolinate synthase [Candidatus Avelusimicrobium stercoris]|uniref:4-hydroxy-tetrahydrodipicolinate synthase n=1 Tax=Candidatus Avelusimicrobium stercoris TaxID=1947924 RepID=UPI003D0C2E03
MFTGVYTALATPFNNQGQVDYPVLERLIQAQLDAQVAGFVLLGTTAEAATLSATEKAEILRFCTPRIKGRAKIIIGTGTNNTASTLQNTREALAFEPDGVLVVTPYYNKPNPSGLIAHYKQVGALGAPIILYHIPGRTGLKLSAATLDRLLSEVPQIVGVKESDYDMAHVTDTAVKYSGKLSYLCGNDDLFPQYLALNAAGIISAAANVFAPAFVQIYNRFQAGQPKEAFALFAQLYPLIKVCYLETNPTCVKYMLSKIGFGTEAVRLPLGEVSAENKQKIDRLLQTADKNLFIK